MLTEVSQVQRLIVVLALNISLVGALLGVGLASGSLGVFAAGADCLADAAAVGVSVLAIRLAARPPSPARPGGYRHATNIAALINSAWLLVLYIVLAVVAAWHLVSGARPVDGLPVLIVSALSAVVLLAGALILGGDADDDASPAPVPARDGTDSGVDPGDSGADSGDDLNVKAVLLDTAADAAASAGVAASGAIIYATGGLYWLDPATALVIAIVVGYHAARLTGRVTKTLRASRA
jgi:cobalt-zinc-cadmium efflux system protein